MANWVSIVQAAARPNGLRVAGPMFYLGMAVVGVGIYCFVASMSRARWLRLPGKGPTIRAAEAEDTRRKFHAVAVSTLAYARLAGLTLRETTEPPLQQVTDWYTNVVRLSTNVWGNLGMHTLTILSVDKTWSGRELVSHIVDPTLLTIEAMVTRVSYEHIDDGLDKTDVARLEESRAFFRSLVDQFYPATGTPPEHPNSGTGSASS